MKALCAFAETTDHPFTPDTRQAVESLWPDHLFVDCRRSETLYHETLEQLWAAGDGFVVVEQDVVPTVQARDEFDRCGEPWCVFVGDLAVGYTPGWLGCVRFSAALVVSEPDVMTEAALDDTSGVPSRLWFRSDVRVDRVLRGRGYSPHIHGRVQHLSPINRMADPDGEWTLFLERLLPAYQPI